MAQLNITYNGVSFDLPGEIEDALNDDKIREIALRSLAHGEIPGAPRPALSPSALADHVVDRLHGRDGKQRIYLRPKVPFG